MAKGVCSTLFYQNQALTEQMTSICSNICHLFEIKNQTKNNDAKLTS